MQAPQPDRDVAGGWFSGAAASEGAPTLRFSLLVFAAIEQCSGSSYIGCSSSSDSERMRGVSAALDTGWAPSHSHIY